MINVEGKECESGKICVGKFTGKSTFYGVLFANVSCKQGSGTSNLMEATQMMRRLCVKGPV